MVKMTIGAFTLCLRSLDDAHIPVHQTSNANYRGQRTSPNPDEQLWLFAGLWSWILDAVADHFHDLRGSGGRATIMAPSSPTSDTVGESMREPLGNESMLYASSHLRMSRSLTGLRRYEL